MITHVPKALKGRDKKTALMSITNKDEENIQFLMVGNGLAEAYKRHKREYHKQLIYLHPKNI